MSGRREKTLRQAHGISIAARRSEKEFGRVIDLASRRAFAEAERRELKSRERTRKLMAIALLVATLAFGGGLLFAAVHG